MRNYKFFLILKILQFGYELIGNMSKENFCWCRQAKPKLNIER